jgi:hypothetical protein
MIGKKTISPIKIILTLLFGYAALLSARHIPLFVIIAIPVLSEQIAAIIKIQSDTLKPSRLSRVAFYLLPVLFLLVTGIRFTKFSTINPNLKLMPFQKPPWIGLKTIIRLDLYSTRTAGEAILYGGYIRNIPSTLMVAPMSMETVSYMPSWMYIMPSLVGNKP